MRVVIMTAGSRGDVAPYTGLGAGLARSGYDVTLATHGLFEPLSAGSGVRFHATPVDPHAVLHSDHGRGLHASTTGLGKLLRAVAMATSAAEEMTDSLVRAAHGADVVLAAGAVAPLGRAIAEGLKLPSLGLFLQPQHPTREFGAPMLGGRSLGFVGNHLGGLAVATAVDRVFTRALHRLRTRHGMTLRGAAAARRAHERARWPVLHGFSELVVPRPGDWRPGLEIAGYWWPYDTRALPGELEDFLAAGPAPVFVGLGSATVPDPGRLSGEIVRALRAAGLRGVIQQGWAGLAARDDDVITVGDVPHAPLFPRMAAVVHHAGAGTTAAVLRAGVPTVPVPVQFDAGFWAARLVELGAAPCAVPLRRLTADTLAPALRRAVRNPAHRDSAQALARRLAEEDGVAPVLAALDRLAS
ncbi:UDP-glucose:sterol glucosyltransferase [Streptomyces viridochromogenes DSM 40736]|uniref:UDP-glucose:sterol glucosyltransferase n=1 Tax=Streptomyces viridochromogenes (strain DSM 40736 / JCM 4977 / BCRC 1201 / Tue 494) TaxID=591159 RepID=D9X4K8_STRVT|nr:glycosyltransferase [Streptomyces viridochromogenes]EFL29667.1 UDP-glucose:sterol glucosyltransferase [Streptomyces viridochromogenes DSM 40736]